MAELLLPDGTSYELPPHGATTIGASEDASLLVPGAADLACVLRPLKGGGFGLKDLGSEEGTWVNGRRVDVVRLRSGDEIAVAGAVLTFRDAAEAVERPSPTPVTVTRTPATRTPATSTRTPAKQPSAPEDSDFVMGTEIAGYEIKGILGHGGMGTVYLAKQLSLHRDVALKVLKSELAEDPSFVEHFIHEARAAARFNHPNVVQVFDVDECQGRPFFSMELLDQGSLEERLRREGPLSVEEAIVTIRDAARGLSYADELGIVHRDIKPDNLMVTSHGVTKICDLGLAGDHSARGKIVGTPHFLSPEQARGEPGDHRSDLYSLGCTLYRLLTGKTPYPRKTVKEILKAHRDEPVPKLSDKLDDVPEELDRMLAKLMAKDPAQRYQHASELAQDAELLLASGHHGNRGLLLALGSIVLVLLLGLGYVIVTGNGNGNGNKTDQPANNAERERLAKELHEAQAKNALSAVPGNLGPLERAARLEAFAKEWKDTEAAAAAVKEAEKLRRDEADRVAKERARIERERQRAKAVGDGAKDLLAAGKPLQAWARALELAGDKPRPPVVEKALNGVQTKVVEALEAFAKKQLAQLAIDVAKPEADLDALQKGYEKSLALNTDDAPLGAAELLTEYGRQGASTLAAARKARAAEHEAHRLAVIALRKKRLVDVVLPALQAGDFDKVDEALTPDASVQGFEAEWKPLLTLRGLVATARRAIAAGAGSGVEVQRDGATVKVTSLASGRLQIQTSDDKSGVGVFDDEALLTAVLDSDAVAKGDRVAAYAVACLAHFLPKTRELIAGLGNPDAKPSVVIPKTWLAKLAGAKDGDLGSEIAAIRALGKLLDAWNRKWNEAADYWAGVLERDYATSIVGIALGISKAAENGR